MREQFIANQQISLITASRDSVNFSSLPSHYDALLELSKKELLPISYIELLAALEDNDKLVLSKKLLRIYLFAASKFGGKKLFNWLQKGSLPQQTSFGDSMSSLNNYAKKITNLEKSRGKTIDKITSTRKKIELKATKTASNSIKKNTEKLEYLNSQYKSQKEIIEQIISEIESSLASGKKL